MADRLKCGPMGVSIVGRWMNHPQSDRRLWRKLDGLPIEFRSTRPGRFRRSISPIFGIGNA